MGYIMPVDNFQYQQYHKRVVKQKRDPYPIEKLQRIQFGIRYKQEKTKEASYQWYSDAQVKFRTEKSAAYTLKGEIYADITGVGKNYEAQV